MKFIHKALLLFAITLFFISFYYFSINTLVWNLKKSFYFSESDIKTLLTEEQGKFKLKIKHELPLLNLSDCYLIIVGSNKHEDKLLYSGKFKKQIVLASLNDRNHYLSIRLLKNNKMYIYGTKGARLDSTYKTATVTLFMQHSKKYYGHYKISYP